MKHLFNESSQVPNTLKPGSFVSLKDYFVGEEQSTNPYASIDDFLDETWNLNFSEMSNAQDSVDPSNSL